MHKYKPSANTPFCVSANLLNKKGFNYRLEMLELNNIKLTPLFAKKSKAAEAIEIAIYKLNIFLVKNTSKLLIVLCQEYKSALCRLS